MNRDKNDSSWTLKGTGRPTPSEPPCNLGVHDMIDCRESREATTLCQVLNDIKQVLITDILDKCVLYRTITIYPIGSPCFSGPNKSMIFHVPNIKNDRGKEKCIGNLL